jgi:hypothetical protein
VYRTHQPSPCRFRWSDSNKVKIGAAPVTH